jgi:hypothetical protein
MVLDMICILHKSVDFGFYSFLLQRMFFYYLSVQIIAKKSKKKKEKTIGFERASSGFEPATLSVQIFTFSTLNYCQPERLS